MTSSSTRKFDYTLDYKELNLRENPHLYRVGKGEQGVLLVEPYKSEILPHWRFRTPEIAQKSSDIIYSLFETYLKKNDFVGADMARKFLQMGYTRSRRYANHKSGRKYSDEPKEKPQKIGAIPNYRSESNKQHYIKTKTKKILPRDPDPEKAQSAAIFYKKYEQAENHPKYKKIKAAHQEKYG